MLKLDSGSHTNAKLMGPNGGEQFWGKVRSTPKLWTAVWFPWSEWLAINTLLPKYSTQSYTLTSRLKVDTRHGMNNLRLAPDRLDF